MSICCALVRANVERLGPRAIRLGLDPRWRDDLGGRVALARALAGHADIEDALVTENHALVIPRASTNEAHLAASFEAILGACAGAALAETREHEVEVVYDGEDLDDVAAMLGISRADVVALHVAHPLRVSFLGFLPGFAYLRGLEPRLAAVPRRASPRPRVPARSVAIAGGMSAVYPGPSAGGWRLLGRAPRFDPLGAHLAPGDRLHFRACTSPPAPEALDAPETTVLRGPQLRLERVVGPAFVVDGSPMRKLADGAPPGGPLVRQAALRAIAAVGGAATDALIERAGPLVVALEHGPARVIADDCGRRRALRPGETLSFPWDGRMRVGYVAVEGGLDVPFVLGGRGTMATIGRGGGLERALRRGDAIPLGPIGVSPIDAKSNDAKSVGVSPIDASSVVPCFDEARSSHVSSDSNDRPFDVRLLHAKRPIPVHPGPDLLDFERAAILLRTCVFRIAMTSDRTGTRLQPRRPLRLATRRVETAPMFRGAVQAPSDNELIVLGPEHPITGGYPIVFVLDDLSASEFFARPLGSEVCLRLA